MVDDSPDVLDDGNEIAPIPMITASRTSPRRPATSFFMARP